MSSNISDLARKTTEIYSILVKLEQAKEKFGSWDELAKGIGVSKRTLLRWKKTRRISPAYIHILKNFL